MPPSLGFGLRLLGSFLGFIVGIIYIRVLQRLLYGLVYSRLKKFGRVFPYSPSATRFRALTDEVQEFRDVGVFLRFVRAVGLPIFGSLLLKQGTAP